MDIAKEVNFSKGLFRVILKLNILNMKNHKYVLLILLLPHKISVQLEASLLLAVLSLKKTVLLPKS